MKKVSIYSKKKFEWIKSLFDIINDKKHTLDVKHQYLMEERMESKIFKHGR